MNKLGYAGWRKQRPLFGTGVEKPHIPARLSPPVLSEWLAVAQGQPCDLFHPDFPSMLRV